MTESIKTLNFSSHLGTMKRQRRQFKIRSPNPEFYVRIPLISLHSNESVNPSYIKLSISNSSSKGTQSSVTVFNQRKKIGIIGGLSAVSLLRSLEKLVKWSSKDGEVTPFIVCNDSSLNRELSFLERKSLCDFTHKKVLSFSSDLIPIIEILQKQRSFLEKSGATCIFMPCHISHSWYKEISEGCSVPFLHVGECVSKELKELKLKPVEAGSSVRVGILAPDSSFLVGIYRENLQNQGFEVVLPDKATTEHILIPAMEALDRKDLEGARNLIRVALQVLLVRAVNVIILPSNDLIDILPQDDPLLKKCVDPMDALIRSAIDWTRSENL